MNIVQAIMTKTPTNAQNIDQINLPFIASHLLFHFLDVR